MMFGIELPEFLRFLIQLSAAVAGSASLWGFYLSTQVHKSAGETALSIQTLLKILFLILSISVTVFLIVWWVAFVLFFGQVALAHIGIVAEHSFIEVSRGFSTNFPFVLLLSFSLLLGFWFYLTKRFNKFAGRFFFTQFVLVSLISVLSVLKESFDLEQLFFFLHSWHSILTLGTVIVLDILYMATLKRDNLKRVLYPIFPLMSLAIWVGLGVDLIGAFIVLLDTLSISSQFLFNQVVVAIIVLNGAFLSGRMSEKLFSLIQTDRILPLSSKTNLIFGISGSVSIVSWLTITFIDFFSFKLSFWQFFAIYLTLIITAFFGQKVLKKW